MVLSEMGAKSFPMDLDSITQDLFTAAWVILVSFNWGFLRWLTDPNYIICLENLSALPQSGPALPSSSLRFSIRGTILGL